MQQGHQYGAVWPTYPAAEESGSAKMVPNWNHPLHRISMHFIIRIQPSCTYIIFLYVTKMAIQWDSNPLLAVWTAIWEFIANLLWPSLPNVPQVWGYPFIGMLPVMLSSNIFTKVMSQFFDAAEHAGLSGSWLGTSPLVYVRDPYVFHQIFIDNAHSVTRVGPDGDGPFGILRRTIGTITVTEEGENWRRWRKGLLSAFSSQASLKRHYKGMLNIAHRHVHRMAGQDMGADLRKVMGDYALDTLWFLALGVDSISDDSTRFLAPLPRFLTIVGDASHLIWHALRNSLRGKPFHESDAFEQSLRNDIQEVVTMVLTKYLDQETAKDSFLRNVSQESGGAFDRPLTPDVLSQALQVYGFGHEASELLLFWGVYELSRNEEVVQKLRQELRGLASSSWDLEFEDIRAMPYLDGIATELLRLHPSVSTTARMTTRPIIVQTKTSDTAVLPKGTQLISSIHLLHHDEQVWGADANKFKPERWAGRRRNELENRCQFLPFLTGPRACPSAGFVFLQVKMLLAVLFFKQDVVLPMSDGLRANIGAVVEPTKDVRYQLKSTECQQSILA